MSRVKVSGPQTVRCNSPWCLSQVPAAGRHFTSDALLENVTRRGSLRRTEPRRRWPFAHRKGIVCSSDVDNLPGALQIRVEFCAFQVISVSFLTTRSQDRNNPIKAHYALIQVSLDLSVHLLLHHRQPKLNESEGTALYSNTLPCRIGEPPTIKPIAISHLCTCSRKIHLRSFTRKEFVKMVRP
jgi:hypothetical protein